MPAGGVNILGGLPHAGKSRLLASWCRSWLLGEKIFTLEVPRLNVCIVSTDRSWVDGTRYWFDKCGIGDIAAYSIQDDDQFAWKKLQRREERPQLLETCVARALEIGRSSPRWSDELGTLIICDTVAPFIPRTMDYNDTFVSISSIRKLATARVATILGTMHAPKLKGSEKDRYVRLTDRVAGSVAISGTADTMFYLGIPEEVDEPHHVLEWRPHNSPRQQFVLKTAHDGLFYTGHERAVAEVAYMKLVELVEHGETVDADALLVRAVSEFDVARATVFRWLKLAVKDGELIRLSRGRYRRPAKVVDMPYATPDSSD
jgi:hypothetical protein